jgi:hypothetical protein
MQKPVFYLFAVGLNLMKSSIKKQPAADKTFGKIGFVKKNKKQYVNITREI